MDYILPRLPLGRIGQPDEIADLVDWLTGPGAGYMTGASLTIDGGWSV
jgi:3-oxoacyl-[acyl-carrier protein] reductase